MKKVLTPTCRVADWEDLSPSKKMSKLLNASMKPSSFWEDTCLGNLTLWPAQKQIIDEFFEIDPKTKKRKYNELWMAAGRGASKTTLLTLIGGYEFFRMNIMDSPQLHYKLAPNSEIQIVNCAPKFEQAQDTIFARFKELMRNSPYLMSQKFEYIGSKIKFIDKNISFQPFGSNSSTAVGRNVKAFLADEVSHFTDKEGRRSAKDVWDELSGSTRRFRMWNEDINCAISNPRYQGDFITSEIAKIKELDLKGILVVKKAVWDMNPDVTYESFDEMRRRDPDAVARLYGAEPADETELFFSDAVMEQITPYIRKDNWFGPNGDIIDITKIRHVPGALGYIVAVDPSAKLDTFGFAVGHFDRNFNIVIDGITSFKKQKHEKLIDVAPIRSLMKTLMSRLNIKTYIFDVYLHSEFLELVREHNIEPFFHQVDRTDYNFWKDDLMTQRTSMPYFEQTIEEMKGLLDIKQKKVDHDSSGSKDTTDAACQITSYIRRWEESDYMKHKKQERKANQSSSGQLGLFTTKFI